MRLQDMTFDLDKARVDAAYVGNICLTYEEWPETDNDMQYILAAVYDLEPALDEIERQAARIKELEAEVEAKNKQIKELQDIIDKPPEDADWVADYHLLQSALDGPIIDAARKWHAAYRKAQNSNLMRAKEVERLRSQSVEQVFRRSKGLLPQSHQRARGGDEECGCKT